MDTVNNLFYFSSYDDYAQSANTLFHFMGKFEYLVSCLKRRALVPRYCKEDIRYLHLESGGIEYGEIAILQKCFCDIPLHNLAAPLALIGTGDAFDSLPDKEKAQLEKRNTHFDFYGEYAIGFSKDWGERHNLQPIHYLNPDSCFCKDFAKLLHSAIEDDDAPDEYVQDIINRLGYIKPLRGVMKRSLSRGSFAPIEVEFIKNFHDEQEWRYIPSNEVLQPNKKEAVIANPTLIPLMNEISHQFEEEQHQALWLSFSFDDIRYLIVPNNATRIDLIQSINLIPDSCFASGLSVMLQKSILTSKILVLDDIRKDW